MLLLESSLSISSVLEIMNNNLVVLLAMIGNVLSVVGIVILNKYITEVDGFNFMVFLSFLHVAFTSLGTYVLMFLGYFQHNSAPLSGVLPVAMVLIFVFFWLY